jgi:hypothetical protein
MKETLIAREGAASSGVAQHDGQQRLGLGLLRPAQNLALASPSSPRVAAPFCLLPLDAGHWTLDTRLTPRLRLDLHRTIPVALPFNAPICQPPRLRASWGEWD